MKYFFKGVLSFAIFLVPFLGFNQSATFSNSLTNNENCGGTIVSFSINDLTNVTSYSWEFGNGEPDNNGSISSSDSGNASTSYVVAGNFTVKLTVNGNVSTTQLIKINALPTPSFYVNGVSIGCLNGFFPVSFIYDGVVPNYGSGIETWDWDFGDGTGTQSQTGGGNVTYDYTTAGNFNVIVEVTDSNGCVNNSFIPQAVELNSSPHANFDFSHPTDCSLPVTVDFYDSTTVEMNSIASWNWTITDSMGVTIGTSTDQNPTYTFVSAGNYLVTLEVVTVNGQCTDAITQNLSFGSNSTSFEPTNVTPICEGQSVTFSNTSVDGVSNPISYLWDFGDGNTSTDESPTHIYLDGTNSPFTVSLSVEFSNGCVGNVMKTDLVEVTATGTSSLTVSEDESCKELNVVATATLGATLYEWDLNYDGVTPNFSVSGANNSISQLYNQEGAYSIFVRSTDAIGCISESTYDSIRINFPVANFTVPVGEIGCLAELAEFDASISSNTFPTSNNAIVNYYWDYTTNNSVDFSSPNPAASHRYVGDGASDVTLIIKTADNCRDTVTHVAAVQRGFPPTASFTFSQANLCIKTPVSFTNTSVSNSLSADPIDSVVWSFGDGSIVRGNPITNPSLNNPSHLYSDDTQEDGVPFTVSLTVYNNGCISNTYSDTLHIDYPVARFTTNSNAGCFGTSSSFQFVAYSASNPNSLSEGVDQYRWDFGDGTLYPGPTVNDFVVGFDPSINHNFTKLGNFVATLFVKNDNSTCQDFFSRTFNVSISDPGFRSLDSVVCHTTGNVSFQNLSISSTTGVTFDWDFGQDAVPATYTGAIPPVVNYTSPGLKTVMLTSTTPSGCIKVETKTDYIDVRGPIADFNWISDNADNGIQCLDPTEDVEFTSTSSNYPNLNANTTFIWTFGNGANPLNATKSNENPVSTNYQTAGNKTVKLLVVDNQGCESEKTEHNVVKVPNPTADFKISSSTTCVGSEINFTDNSTHPQGVNISTYVWNFGANSSPSSHVGKTPPVITYASPGVKTVTLDITNDKGCTSSYSEDVTIYEPNASFTNLQNIGCAPEAVQFTNTSYDIASSSWDFGDTLSNGSTANNPSFTYLYPGEYEVTLTTVSLGGCLDTATVPSSVIVAGPYFDSASYTMDQPCLASPFNPEVVISIYGLTDTKTFQMDFGDGSPAYSHVFTDPSNLPSVYQVTHVYDKMGSFSVKVTLEDDPNGNGACGEFIYLPAIGNIIISEPPTAWFTSNTAQDTGCLNLPIKFKDKTENTGGLTDSRYPLVAWNWNFDDVNNSTSNKQNPSFTYTQTGSYDVSLEVITAIGCKDTVINTVIIDPTIIDTTMQVNDTVCEGTRVVLDGATPTGGTGSYDYLWEQSADQNTWNAAPGSNDQEDYTTSLVSSNNVKNFYYRRLVSSATCQYASPNFMVRTWGTSLGGNLGPNSGIECFGNHSNELNLTGQRGQILNWESDTLASFNTTSIIANTTNKYTYTNLTSTTYFRVGVQNGVCPPTYSTVATVNVVADIIGNQFTNNDTLICYQEDPGALQPSLVSGGAGTFTYLWQESTNGTVFTNTTGSGVSYSPGMLTDTLWLRRIVVSNNNCSDTSNVLEIDVIPTPDNSLNTSNVFVCAEAPPVNSIITVQNSELNVSYQLRIDATDAPVGTAVLGTGGTINLVTSTPILSTLYNVLATPSILNGAGNTCMGIELLSKSTITIIAIPSDALVVSDPIACEGQNTDIVVTSSEPAVMYYLKDAGTNLDSALGNGNDIVLMLSSAPSASVTYNVFARSTLNSYMCAEVQLVDPAVITIIPAPDNAMAVSDPDVCGGTGNFDISIANTVNTVNYTLIESGSTAGTTLSGNNGTLIFSVPEPTQSTSYSVWARPIQLATGGACDSIRLADSSVVTYAPIPGSNLTVMGDTICTGSTGQVVLKQSEPNVSYQLFEGGMANGVAVAGTGSDLVFGPLAPTTNESYFITAVSTVLSGCAGSTLKDTAIIHLIPDPIDVPASILPNGGIICSRDTAYITLTGTQTGIIYTLTKGGIGIPGQEIIGDGTDQVFQFEVLTSGVFKIKAIPVELNANGNACTSYDLSTTFAITVDGPVRITGHPYNANICSGGEAEFDVTATNGANGPLSYQWQESVDSVNFADIADGAIFIGTTSTHLLVNDITGKDNYFYRAVVSSTSCPDLISEVGKITISALPVTTGITISVDDGCLGNPFPVNYTSSLVANQSYKLFYEIIGTNASGLDSLIFTQTSANGTGIINIPAGKLTNPGSNGIIIKEIDFANGQQCKTSGLYITDLFVVEVLPDTSNLSLTSSTICEGDSALINVSSNLTDNVYSVVYNLSGSNTLVNDTLSLSVLSGMGTMTLPSAQMVNPGMTHFEMTEILFSNGQLCGVDGFIDSVNILIESKPDTAGLNLQIDDICSGLDVPVNVMGSLADGTYAFQYNMVGVNFQTALTDTLILSNGDGTGTFSIDASLLVNDGLNSVIITQLYFTNGNGCGFDAISTGTSFIIEQTPNLNGAELYTETICEGESERVVFTSNLPDENYEFRYTVTGPSRPFDDSISISITNGIGNALFTIDSNLIPNPGQHTVILTQVIADHGLMCSTNVSAYKGFSIEPLPDTSDIKLVVDSVCPNTDAMVHISGNTLNGTYYLVYNLTGANVNLSVPVIVDFTQADGSAQFEIPGSYLTSSGVTEITLTNFVSETGNRCGISGVLFDTTFVVEDIPDAGSIALSVDNICFGESAVVALSSSLADGLYAIVYDIENDNYLTDNHDTIRVVSGAASFGVEAGKLYESGTSVIAMNSVKALFGQQCSVPFGITAADTFDIEDLPLVQGASFFAQDDCQGEDIDVHVISNLLDGDYLLTYHFTGANILLQDTISMYLRSGNGDYIFTVPSGLVPNQGATTIWIDGIAFKDGNKCGLTLNESTNFTVSPVPDISNMDITGPEICQGEDAFVIVSSQIADGNYEFVVSLTGANNVAGTTLNVDFFSGNGSAIFAIPAVLIPNSGITEISVNEIVNKNALNCTSFVVSVSDSIEISPIPVTDSLSLFVKNICLTFDALVEVNGNLADGLYDITYDLTGTNSVTNEPTQIMVTNGQASFTIPTALLPNTGATEVIITYIQYATGFRCFMDVNVSYSFIVSPDPGATTVNISVEDICKGSEAVVQVSSIFPDGNYTFTYNLNNANVDSSTTIEVGFGNGNGTSSFSIPDSLLINSGIQNMEITEIDVLASTSCSSAGLSILDTFNIEGEITIVNQVFDPPQCKDNAVNYTVEAENEGAGNFYYQWYESVDGSNFDPLTDFGPYSGSTTSNLNISSNTAVENTWYQCYVTTDHCPAQKSDSIFLEVLKGSVCGEGLENIPNAISPNGDNDNDIWVIEGIQNYPNNKVQVFNRWGELVYESMGYDNSSIVFNGVGNVGLGKNSEVTDGTFFYLLDLGDGTDIIKGFIVVNR